MNVSNFLFKVGIGLLVIFQMVNGMESEDNRWECSICTTHNIPSNHFCDVCKACARCTYVNNSSSKICEMCKPANVQVPNNVIHKTVVLFPGTLGIQFVTNEPGRNGLIIKVNDTAQESFHEAGITKGCTIIKLDDEDYSYGLLQFKKHGEDIYCMEITCPLQNQREQEDRMNFILDILDIHGEFNKQQLIEEMQNNYGFSFEQPQQLHEDFEFKDENLVDAIDKIEINNNQDDEMESGEEEEDIGKIVDTGDESKINKNKK